MLIKPFIPAFEVIDFQSGAFGRDLENALGEMVQTQVSGKKLSDIIKHHTNLNVTITTNTDNIACVYIPTFHNNHIFFNNAYREYYRAYAEEKGHVSSFRKLNNEMKKHTVSMKDSRVTGLFAEMEVDIHFDFDFFKKYKFSPAQMAAIIMHEVGHLFTIYELMAHKTTQNTVLAALCDTIKTDLPDQREFIFKEAESALSLNAGDLKEVYNSKDASVISTVVIQKSSLALTSQTGLQGYDLVSCEQMADQFVSRHGYGRHVIEALDLLHSKFGMKETKDNYYRNLIGDTFSLSCHFGATILSIAVGMTGWGFFFGLTLLLNFIFSGAANEDHTYDTTMIRFKRVRDDMVASLKNPKAKYSSQEIKIITKDIEDMDGLLDTLKDYTPLMARLKNFLFKKHRDFKDSMDFQHELEDFAANSLFVKAAQLRNM